MTKPLKADICFSGTIKDQKGKSRNWHLPGAVAQNLFVVPGVGQPGETSTLVCAMVKTVTDAKGNFIDVQTTPVTCVMASSDNKKVNSFQWKESELGKMGTVRCFSEKNECDVAGLSLFGVNEAKISNGLVVPARRRISKQSRPRTPCQSPAWDGP